MSLDQENSGLDVYRKTCSIIFGRATASQLKYLSTSIELQQSALTSCDGIIANQLRWLENYIRNNKGNIPYVDIFLKNYTATISVTMNLITITYDLLTQNLQSYTKALDSLNQYFFGITKTQGEIEGLPLSQ
jgi:hypothetical protein